MPGRKTTESWQAKCFGKVEQRRRNDRTQAVKRSEMRRLRLGTRVLLSIYRWYRALALTVSLPFEPFISSNLLRLLQHLPRVSHAQFSR